MATKIVKFKAKRKKGAVKRLKLTAAKNSVDSKIVINRINKRHRLIGKTGERKLKAQRKTTVSSAANKYKNFIS